MKINFKITENDIVAFSQYQYKNSRSIIKTLRILYVVLPMILFIISFFVFRNTTDNFKLILASSGITTILFIIIFWILLKINLKFIVPRIIIGMLKKDSERTMIGNCSLEIQDDNLVEVLNNKIIKLKISDIKNLEESDTHLFIFISETVAVIVPKQDINQEELNSFSEALYQKFY